MIYTENTYKGPNKLDIKDAMIGRAKKFNQYNKGEFVASQSCKTCIRKHFSFPYTCNDGWPMGDSNWKDQGATCINWSNKSDCQVD